MVILKTDQIESIVLDEGYEGFYQVALNVFGAAVKMQFSDDGGSTWVDGYFNGNLIQLDRLGAILDQKFTRGRHYRFVTATAGSQVSMFKHDQAG